MMGKESRTHVEDLKRLVEINSDAIHNVAKATEAHWRWDTKALKTTRAAK